MMGGRTTVGIITGNPPTMMGGVERFTLTLAQQFEDRGISTNIYDSTLLAEGKSKWYDKFLLSGLRRDKAIGKKAGEKMKVNPVQVIIHNGNSGWAVSGRGTIPRIVVHHGTWRGVAPNLCKNKAPLKTKVANKIFTYGLLGYIEKYTSEGARSVSVSSSVARELIDYYGIKSVVIPNGVDIKHFCKRDKFASKKKYGFERDDKVICFTGRLEFGKGSDIIRKIADLALNSDYRIKFLIATDKAPEEDWPANVVIVKNVDYDEMPYLYSAGDIFLFPSRYEGCSYSVLEAMACGVPIIISSVGYGRDLQRDNILANFIIDNLEPRLYWQKILELCDDELGCKVGNAGLEFIRKHNTINIMVNKYIDLIHKVISEKSGSGR